MPYTMHNTNKARVRKMEKQAIISITKQDNGKNYGGEKETVNSYSLVVLQDDGTLGEIVSAVVYMGRSRTASKVYASVWLGCYERSVHTSGTGSAGGYGYHKVSAAVGDAFASAGVELAQDIKGRGTRAIYDALKAIAEHFGYKTFVIV